MNTATKRRKRHRANAKLKHGAAAVRKHMRKSGRTGGIWKKRTHGKHAAQVDTRAQRRDVEQARPVRAGSAVGNADAPRPCSTPSDNLSNGEAA